MNEERRKDFEDIAAKVRELMRKGSVTRIVIKNRDGKEVFGFSANTGALGGFLILSWAPSVLIAAAFIAAGTGALIEVVRENGEVVDVNGAVVEAAHICAEKAADIFSSYTKKPEDPE